MKNIVLGGILISVLLEVILVIDELIGTVLLTSIMFIPYSRILR